MLTIVLVHGAFADVSRWNGVIALLQRQGDGSRGSLPANVGSDASSPISPCGETYWSELD